MPSKWNLLTDEQKKNYSDQNVAMKKAKREAKLRDEQARSMLANFLSATTPHEKRKVIKDFTPYYFVFGDKLDPRNPYEKEIENETV